MEELFKYWAETSNNLKEFVFRFSWWLVTHEVDPDNCYPDDELESMYNKYKIKG